MKVLCVCRVSTPKVTCVLPQRVQLLFFLDLRLRARGNSDTAPLLPSLVLNLSPLPPQPQTSLPYSGSSESTLPPHSHQMGSMWQTELWKHLVFRSPLPEGEAMKQAQSWHQAQLLDLWQLWELR
jgi:hypothetical protein